MKFAQISLFRPCFGFGSAWSVQLKMLIFISHCSLVSRSKILFYLHLFMEICRVSIPAFSVLRFSTVLLNCMVASYVNFQEKPSTVPGEVH